MLTKELLQANLQGLTDEQVTKIVTLSQNDENAVIGARFGEVYRQLDETIEKETGVKRNGDEKTYNYLERAAREIKSKLKDIEPLNQKITELEAEKTRLETALKDGANNEEAKKQLEQAQKDIANVTKQYTDLRKEFDKATEKHAKELLDVQISHEIGLATAGLKFKSEIPQTVADVIMKQAVEKVKAMKPEYVDNGQGGKLLAFKGEDGAILRNKDNQLNPYTAQELIAQELKNMGVLDEGRKAAGAGSKTPTGGGNGGSAVVDISGAKTRTEAYDIIAQGLFAQGLTNGSAEFDAAMQQAWKDNNVANLPMN